MADRYELVPQCRGSTCDYCGDDMKGEGVTIIGPLQDQAPHHERFDVCRSCWFATVRVLLVSRTIPAPFPYPGKFAQKSPPPAPPEERNPLVRVAS